MPKLKQDTVENPRAFHRKNEIQLSPHEISATYIVGRLHRTEEPLFIRCNLAQNVTPSQVTSLFTKIVEAIQSDIWLKYAILLVDGTARRITFHNGSVVYFMG